MLRFLVKSVFWISLVILLVPTEPKDGAADAKAAINAAWRIVVDATGFCGRNPEACETVASLADTFRRKAEAALRQLYAFSHGRSDAAAPPENTLSPDDHQPAWREPPEPPG